MRSGVFVLFALALGVLVAGCCMQFSDVNVGDTYQVGDSFVDKNTTVEVEQFQWSNGNWSQDGFAKVTNSNYTSGSGNEMNTNNTNLHFLFDYPREKITLLFADLGGNSNIEVNGNFQNVNGIELLDGTTVGGVSITVDAVTNGNNWVGKLELEGNIEDFKIGGQELWIDKVCK